MFLVVKMDPLNGVSHNVGVYTNLITTLNEDLMYINRHYITYALNEATLNKQRIYGTNRKQTCD
jgi:hypothetical protein